MSNIMNCFLLVSETTEGPWKQLFTTFMTIGGRVLVAGAKNKALVAQVFDFVGPGQKGSGPSCGLLVGPTCFHRGSFSYMRGFLCSDLLHVSQISKIMPVIAENRGKTKPHQIDNIYLYLYRFV